MPFLYHFSGNTAIVGGNNMQFDGTLETKKMISSPDEFEAARKHIGERNNLRAGQFAVVSLTLLNPPSGHQP